jgi:tetratricopeptide (TPR) repeat protein
MAIRPRLSAPAPHPNIAGGLIAVLAPFMLALLIDAWKKRRGWRMLYALATGGMAAIGLLMSSSRAAWLALGLALGGWLLWGLCGALARGDLRRQRLLFIAAATFLLCAGAALALRIPGGLKGLLNRLPGHESTISRLEIIHYSLRLVRDFPYTGGGLESFAGLFSRYIKVEPNFIISYGHNLSLDVALEQGLPGLAAFLAILAGAAWLLLTGKRGHGLHGMVLAALLVMLVHGLVDDPLYGNRGTPFLFLVPGLVVMVTGARRQRPSPLKRVTLASSLLVGILLAAILAYTFRRPLLSTMYADRGAVEMARVELAGFPTGKFDDGSRAAELAPAESLFTKALALDPGNVTANYRLGLAALLRRDFPAAQTSLEKAYSADPGHRGVQKSLGYCYVWLGQLERAGQVLSGIPEARREMEAYVSWWQEQGRPDLARWAGEMVAGLP